MGKKGILLIVLAAAIVLVVYFGLLSKPASEDQTKATIGAVEKYRVQQMGDEVK